MARSRITIGRSTSSDVIIDERWDTVSNNHADIELREGQLIFIDHSSNGTTINGQKIHNTTVGIYQGDIIMLAGRVELSWETISKYFPQTHRPTVTKNVRAEQQTANSNVGGRKTVNQQAFAREDENKKDTYGNNSSSRATQQFSQQTPYVSNPRGTVATDYQTDDNYGKENIYSQAEIDREIGKWNWGAFFCSWIWAVCHRIYWPLAIIVVAFVPYLGQVASLVLSVYLGMTGSKKAWNSGKYTNFQAYKSAQKKWAIAGIILFVIGICTQAYIVCYTLMLI